MIILVFSLLVVVGATLLTQGVLASSNNEEEEITREPETCFTLTISECNRVNAMFTANTFPLRCQVTLVDGQLVTIYKEPTKTCSALQDELGGMTYQRYQEETMQELSNDLSESASKFGELFNPPSLSDRIEDLNEKLDRLSD